MMVSYTLLFFQKLFVEHHMSILHFITLALPSLRFQKILTMVLNQIWQGLTLMITRSVCCLEMDTECSRMKPRIRLVLIHHVLQQEISTMITNLIQRLPTLIVMKFVYYLTKEKNISDDIGQNRASSLDTLLSEAMNFDQRCCKRDL